MKRMILVISLAILAFGQFSNSFAAFDLQFVIVRNDMTLGGYFDAKVQIRYTGSAFQMGSSQLVFTYDNTALSAPSLLTAHNFNGGMYFTMTVTNPAAGRTSVNIELLVPNNGTAVTSSYMDVVTIRYTILDPDGNPNFVWRTITPNPTFVFDDDESTLVSAGNLNPLDATLPVELGSFTAVNLDGVVKLQWTTQSEQNNVGFNIYRSTSPKDGFKKINGSLIAAAGTSATPNTYSFIDDRLQEKGTYYYRLEDIDIEGQTNHHGPVTITVDQVKLPENFYVQQNYPNPFNPSTTLEYGLPEAASVRVMVYNVRGELVRTLVNGNQTPGHKTLTWNGANDNGTIVPTGIYICRIQAGGSTKAIKMMFAK